MSSRSKLLSSSLIIRPCFVYFFYLLVFISSFVETAQFYITNPLNGTVWQAGYPANVTWLPVAANSINIELIPSTDLNPRVVAILAEDIPGTTSSIKFVVPDNLPTWTYGIRMYDPVTLDGYSFSPAFLILDKKGDPITTTEPNFPLAPAPKACLNNDDCDSGNATTINSVSGSFGPPYLNIFCFMFMMTISVMSTTL